MRSCDAMSHQVPDVDECAMQHSVWHSCAIAMAVSMVNQEFGVH